MQEHPIVAAMCTAPYSYIDSFQDTGGSWEYVRIATYTESE